MATRIAAIDQGTTSTRCMIVGKDGAPLAMQAAEHKQIYPQPGWVEHDPSEIWQRTCQVIRDCLKLPTVSAGEIAAVGITNQRETTVVWDRATGKPLHNALVWMDTRTSDLVATLIAKLGSQDALRATTGLPLSTYFSGLKLKWLIENVAEVRNAVDERRALFGTIDTWLVWNLTGGAKGGCHVTDVTNASRTMLMDLATLTWDKRACDTLGVPMHVLPEIRSSSEVYGYTTPDGPFGRKVPVAGIVGDQQAAMVGQACLAEGDVKNTYGTGCFMLLNTGATVRHSKKGLLTTVCYKFGTKPTVYALEGSVAIGGALVQWLRDNLKIIRGSSEVEALARTVADNGDVYFVPAFSGLYAPYWRRDARGVIVGMTRFTTAGHIARAALESTAYQVRDVLEAMQAESGTKLLSLKADGGMVADELLMQFQADLLGIPVVRPTALETTAIGAAYAAGLAVGLWSGEKEIRANWSEGKRWLPDPASTARTRLYERWKQAVTRSYGWVE